MDETILNRLSRSELIEYVQENTTELDLLVALAEEATEFAQAALKLARARKYVNHPTPVEQDQAFKDLLEEYADVTLCCKALALEDNPALINKKALRWAKRLHAVEKEE